MASEKIIVIYPANLHFPIRELLHGYPGEVVEIAYSGDYTPGMLGGDELVQELILKLREAFYGKD